MNRSRKTALFAGIVIALTATGIARSDTLKIGVAAEPYPPFASPDASGKWTGWEIEIANAICEQAKLECAITPVAWDGIIPALNSKKIDAIMASMSITAERLKSIEFSDKYYKSPTSVIGPKDSKFDATPDGLKGKVIGVQISTVYEDYAKKHFGDAAEIKVYQTQDDAQSDLASGRIDAVEADTLSLESFLASEQGKSCCELKGSVVDDDSVLGPGVAVGLRKGDTKLKDTINAAIAGIRSNGKYDSISKKYFSFDIYGG